MSLYTALYDDGRYFRRHRYKRLTHQVLKCGVSRAYAPLQNLSTVLFRALCMAPLEYVVIYNVYEGRLARRAIPNCT